MGFREVIERAGFCVDSYYERGHRMFDPMGRLWAQDRAIQKWVAALPKPVGIFAPNDIWGVQLTEVCLRADMAVPEDVAILSVDDDDLLCDFARPPLSSVSLPTERIGYESAAQLDRMMRGAKIGRRPILFPPIGVIARRSTEILAVADLEVRAALRFIRDQAHRPIRVTDLLREVPTSRRSLERRFRTVLGRSLLDEIRRVHVERARLLLTQTDLSLDRVAESSGFTDAKRFSTVFREAAGMTPRAFRIQFRCGPVERGETI